MDKNLYQQVILEHNHSPKNFRELESPTCSLEGHNPLCGDHYFIYFKCNECNKNLIELITFKGEGCAISKASASMMSDVLKGKNIYEIELLFEYFQKLVKGEKLNDKEKKELDKLIVFSNVYKYPSRVKCAILTWHTLMAALKNKKETVSNE